MSLRRTVSYCTLPLLLTYLSLARLPHDVADLPARKAAVNRTVVCAHMAIVAYSGYDLPALAPVAAGGEAQRRALRAAVGAAAPWAEASTVQQAEEAHLAAPISKARLIDLYARPMWTAARRRRLVGRGWPELGAAWQHGGHLLALVKLCFRHRAAPLTAAIARL